MKNKRRLRAALSTQEIYLTMHMAVLVARGLSQELFLFLFSMGFVLPSKRSMSLGPQNYFPRNLSPFPAISFWKAHFGGINILPELPSAHNSRSIPRTSTLKDWRESNKLNIYNLRRASVSLVVNQPNYHYLNYSQIFHVNIIEWTVLGWTKWANIFPTHRLLFYHLRT